MPTSLENVEFLARSPHRIEVLDAITESPRARHELRELTGASRVTVNRILDDLEERDWLVREDGRCEPTPQGRFVAGEVTRLLENVETAAKLDGALGWLPTDAFEFDLAHLADAEVLRTESWEDHTATIGRIVDLISDATRIRGSAIGFSHEAVDAMRDVTVEGECTFDVVVDEPTLGMIRGDEALRSRFREMLASGRASMYRYEGEDPLHMVMAIDDTVVVCGHVEDGPPPGTVETTDDAVRSWADSYYESALEASRPVDADALAPGEPEEV